MVTVRRTRLQIALLSALIASGALALALPVHAQTFSYGPPASATSMGPNGQPNGQPASVSSPRPPVAGVHSTARPVFRSRGPLRRFGKPRDVNRNIFVAVPLFYPIYYGEGNVADPYVPASTDPGGNPSDPAASDSSRTNDRVSNDRGSNDRASEEELRQAYLQGAREALAQERDANRSGRHAANADDKAVASARASDDVPRRKKVEEAPEHSAQEPARDDNAPTAVFIFKDGHKLETKNFAIMGSTLYDLSGNGVRKVQLTDLNKEATLKENDDRGIQLKLP